MIKMDEVAPDLEKNWTLRGHFWRCEMLQKIQKYTGAFPCNPRLESRITSCPRSDPMLSVLWRAVTRLPQPSHPGPVRRTSARLPPGDGTSQMREGRSEENVLYNLYSWVMLRPHHNPNFSLSGLPGGLPGSLGRFPGPILQGHQLRPGRLKGRTSLTLEIPVLSTHSICLPT